ncbi:putative membrane protein YiaA [Paenibacillus shirakamiensis]|uniref:Membrane protein YiaA n=1 Tax=Paenibacillus shirakamiensis TaxID=1265935 RepID=A0ABS4JFU7_9BACL|nr:DUF3953 domain-containing protein [Paenibacillus shirakamiensis]MBP1999996.1 putative membrane protein YiaA [Paenibacillus shirakamiensis]
MVLKISKMILALIVIATSFYCLITKTFELMPYMMLCLGVFMLIIGLEDLQKGRKGFWYMSIIVALFVLIVSIQNLILN